jgi:hypothetical protein
MEVIAVIAVIDASPVIEADGDAVLLPRLGAFGRGDRKPARRAAPARQVR